MVSRIPGGPATVDEGVGRLDLVVHGNALKLGSVDTPGSDEPFTVGVAHERSVCISPAIVLLLSSQGGSPPALAIQSK